MTNLPRKQRLLDAEKDETRDAIEQAVCPQRKVMYATKSRARLKARRLARKNGGGTCRVYLCPHCEAYHLTSQKLHGGK